MEPTAPLMDVVQVSLANRSTKLQGAMALKLIQQATAAQGAGGATVPSAPVKVAPAEGSTVHVIA